MSLSTILLLSIALLLLAALLLRMTLRDSRKDREMVARLRGTDLYSHIYPIFRKHDEIWLESVTIRPESITFRMIQPYGWTDRYTFNRHGLVNPAPDTLYALALAAMVDIDVLRDRRKYAFRTLTETLPNGEKQHSYEYIMRKRWHRKALELATLPPEPDEDQ